MNLSLEHPWVWFSSLQTVTQIVIGVCAFLLLSLLLGLFVLIDEDLSHPDKGQHPVYRFAVGVLLELGLIIYFWPKIYHFFRWWLPYENFFVQMGSLLLVFFCMVMIGHHIECGLLGGGFGKRNYPSMGSGLQREHGLISVTALLLGMLSMLYAGLFTIIWSLSSLWELVHKLF
jgi:hypothetical protein